MPESPLTSILAMANKAQEVQKEEPTELVAIEDKEKKQSEENDTSEQEFIEKLREQHRQAQNPSKLYDSKTLRKRPKTGSGQFKLITFQNSSVIIEFQDVKSPFASISGSLQNRPQNIKNGHAIFHRISEDDDITLSLTDFGQCSIKIINKEQEEELQLGCVFKFEFKHDEHKSLVVRQEDITDDMQVIGGLGSITFLTAKKSQELQEENLRLKRIREEEQRHEVAVENIEATSPVNWQEALKFLSKQEEQPIEIDPND